MYRDLGFLRVWGGLGGRARGHAPRGHAGQPPAGLLGAASADGTGVAATGEADGHAGAGAGGEGTAGEGAAGAGSGCPPYAYLIYPHRPIVAYLPQTGTLLNEYCVAFPDHSRPYGSARLPDSDDVLAKWMALTADERRLVGEANMHLPGRQVDPDRVRRDLVRLAGWERERAGGGSSRPGGSDLGNVRAA
jgi:hypothetical protein